MVSELRCLRCGHEEAPSSRAYLCPRCEDRNPRDPGILDVRYDYDKVAEEVARGGGWLQSRHDIFRFLPLLPVEAPGPVLPSGGTPLFAAPRLARRLGLRALYLKDETRNPTRCLKDRATAVGLTRALQQERKTVYCASAGNAAISLAGFSAHAGLECHAYVPRAASPERLQWLERYGARTHISSGNYDQAFAESEEAGREGGWYSRNCAYNPFLVEGKKTAALEVAEGLGWRAPDLLVAPVGDGCTLAAQGKAFRELALLGLVESRPRLVGVQSAGVQPMVRMLQEWEGSDPSGVLSGDPPEAGTGGDATGAAGTAAASMDVKTPRNARRLLAELRDVNGQVLAVEDDRMEEARSVLAREAGVVAELTSAAALAGLEDFLHADGGGRDRTAVVLVTGGRES